MVSPWPSPARIAGGNGVPASTANAAWHQVTTSSAEGGQLPESSALRTLGNSGVLSGLVAEVTVAAVNPS